MAVKKPDDKVTRQMKRHATIEVNGKSIRMLDHLAAMAKKLPRLTNKETGTEFDHYEHLKGIYMESGINGVDAYLKTCSNIVRRDSGRWWIVRFWARMNLRKHKK